MVDEPLAYCGGWLDRAVGHRIDPGWLAEMRVAVGTRIVPLWQDRCLVSAGRPVRLPSGVADLPDEPMLLGLDDAGNGIFAVDLSALPEREALLRSAAEATVDVRALVHALDPAEAALLGYARGLLHWHRNQRYCGSCGSATDCGHGGALRVCRGCGKSHFPRIEPAVIVLVESPAEPAACLLGRPRGAVEGAYATLAGFVEIGESLEDAVRREVAEETGVRIGPVTYQASQAWPFPAGLMVGFRARAVSQRVRVDPAELAEARWFTRPQLRELLAQRPSRVDSIESHLLRGWLAEAD